MDHTDDRDGYLGPAHRRRNRAAGARAGNAKRAKGKRRAPRLEHSGIIVGASGLALVAGLVVALLPTAGDGSPPRRRHQSVESTDGDTRWS